MHYYCETAIQIWGKLCRNSSQISWNFRSMKCTISVNSYFKRMIKKYEETGSIKDCKLPVHHCTGQSLDNIAAVSDSVAESA